MIEMYFWVPLIWTWWDSGTPEYLPLVTCPFDLHKEGSATALLLVKQHAYQMDCFILRDYGQMNLHYPLPRWWFQIFFIFTPTLGNNPSFVKVFQLGWNYQQAAVDSVI